MTATSRELVTAVSPYVLRFIGISWHASAVLPYWPVIPVCLDGLSSVKPWASWASDLAHVRHLVSVYIT